LIVHTDSSVHTATYVISVFCTRVVHLLGVYI